MRHFNISEFDSADLPGSGSHMDIEFLKALDNARELAGVPFKINSGFRSKAHNEKVGGVEGSSHTKGYAADIHCSDSRSRSLILDSLISVGFNRFGISKSFIHVDNDPNKSANVIWLY